MKTNKGSLAHLSSKLSDFPSDIFNGINLENNAQDWEMSISQVSGKWFLLTLSPYPTWLLWENSQHWTNISTSTILQNSDWQGLNRSKRFLPCVSCLFSCPHGGLPGSLVNPSPCPRACPCEPSLEEMPTPLTAGTNLWFIKTSGQFVQIADVVLTQRDSYSGNLKWGPGIITFSKHPGDSDADFDGDEVPGFEKPRSIGSKTFYKVSQRAPLAPKCLYVNYLPAVCNCSCDLENIS